MTANTRTLALLFMVATAVVIVPWVTTAMSLVLSAASLGRESAALRLELVAGGITRDIAEYVGAGIALPDAVGLSDYLGEELGPAEGVVIAAVETPEGRVVGRWSAPGRLDLVSGATDAAALEQAGVVAAAFPVVVDGAVVGRLVLGRATDVSPPGLDGAGLRFVVVLVTALLLAGHMVLSTWRDLVERPQQTVVALQQRMAERKFDASSGDLRDGPVGPLAEALNRLLVAVNDRVARAHAYLLEVRDFSFNRDAAAAAGQLGDHLTRSGAFAPDGLVPLRLDHGGLAVGPATFRITLVAAIAAGMVMTGGDASIPPVAAVTAAVAGAAAGAFLRLLPPVPRPAFAAGLAAAIIVVLPVFHEALFALPLLALATAAAVAAVAGVASRHPAITAGTAVHGALGLSAGAGVVHLESLVGGTWMSWVVAILALVGLALQGSRFGTAAAARGNAGVPQRPLALALPIVAWAGAGLWLAAVTPFMPGAAFGTIVLWGAHLAAAVGAGAMLLVLYRWRSRMVAVVTIPAALAVAAVVAPLADAPLAVTIGGLVIGAAAPAARGLQALDDGGTAWPWASLAAILGVVAGWVTGPVGAAGLLVLCALAAAAAAAAEGALALRGGLKR
ncbi:hypothetical protein [Caenispirillum bisanense]|uniref:Uncharacterized protein n=1 Tax=Caenispirillum bisanense TaxID=414052 RepID=A0A286GZ33_9PROT|nr:hypothetical protein [Caenispirillum bisanense]SOE00359.1 hypothetical protein SAMN05421508_11255 [Caenispirillum bisanense]